MIEIGDGKFELDEKELREKELRELVCGYYLYTVLRKLVKVLFSHNTFKNNETVNENVDALIDKMQKEEFWWE